jgi:hypothetical protein
VTTSVTSWEISTAGITFNGSKPIMIRMGVSAVPYPIPRLESRYSLTNAVIPTRKIMGAPKVIKR